MTPEIRKFLAYYTEGRGRGVAIRGIVRSNDLREDAEQIFREEGVPVELVWLAQVESGWRNTAVSPVGAAGVWQFMPATAQRFGMDPNERADFDLSTRAAAKYLRILANRYDGNWPLAIGAYNCGEGAMDRAIARTGSRDFWAIARSGALPTETANYVPAVLAASVFGDMPADFELDGRDAVADQLSTKK
jgi:membrane-bound lytic murein transglycosylase D